MRTRRKVLHRLIVVLMLLSVGFVGFCFAFPYLTEEGEAEAPAAVVAEPIEAVPEIEEEPLPMAPMNPAIPGAGRLLVENTANLAMIGSFEAATTCEIAIDAKQAADRKAAEEKARKEAEEKAAAEEAARKEAEEKAAQAAQQAEASGEDRSAPVFLVFDANPKIKPGTSFDIHKYIGYADDLDRDVELEVVGSVDTNVEGTYPLTVTIRDDAGKTTARSMEVKVRTPAAGSGDGESGGKKEDFADFRSTYRTEDTNVGIDISRWQESVDFEKVKAAGCEFVYMRIGGLDDGEYYTDRYYAANIAGAKAAGLKIGIYWHAEEGSPEQVKVSIDYLMSVLGGEQLDFPIAYDWEDYKNFERYGMNLRDLNALYETFEAEIAARGYKACLYGSKSFQENVWTCKKNHPIWLAHYTKSTSYQGDYFMWQHSATGRIDGIAGDVDLDVFYPGKMP